MVFASSVVYFDSSKGEEVEKAIAQFPNVEIHGKDMDNGKLVIVTEAESDKEIETVENILKKNDAVYDVAHFAFHFGEEVEGLVNGTIKPDKSFDNFFKKERDEIL